MTLGSRSCRVVTALAGLAVLSIPLVAFGSPASATNFDVTNSNDAGPGSLRQALLDAASNPGADTIAVQAGLGTITLQSPIDWNSTDLVSIQGNGIVIDAGGHSAALADNSGGGVGFNDFTITGVGVTGTTGDSAPIVSEGGVINVSKCTITGNTVDTREVESDAAGGVLSEGGNVTIDACTITNNTVISGGDAAGGALSEGGPLVVTGSTVSGNQVTNSDGDGGGGLLSEGGDVRIASTTVDCNAVLAGPVDAAGGLLSEGGAVNVDNSSFVGNAAVADGTVDNAILSVGPTPNLTNTTVSDDTSSCTQPPETTTTTAAPATTTSTAAPAATPVATTAAPSFTG